MYPNLPIFLAGEEPEPPKDGANSISDTESLLLRPQFDRLSPEEKRPIMERLAAQYRLDFVRMEHFGRWGQHCTTGIFKKMAGSSSLSPAIPSYWAGNSLPQD